MLYGADQSYANAVIGVIVVQPFVQFTESHHISFSIQKHKLIVCHTVIHNMMLLLNLVKGDNVGDAMSVKPDGT